MKPPSLLSCLAASRLTTEFLVGDFDNYAQVVEERRQGVEAVDDDGHEHIHCTLRPLRRDHVRALVGTDDEATLACYYLDADPRRVFRLRVYRFPRQGLTMELFRPRDVAEAHDLAVDLPSRSTDDVVAALDPVVDWEYVNGCDVAWRAVGDAFRGEMVAGTATIPSQRNPKKLIVVQDDLEVSTEAILVNDRAFEADTGRLVYGSLNGIPYRLERVDPDDPAGLRWTLGAAFGDQSSYLER